MSVAPAPTRLPVIAWVCVALGLAILVASVTSAVLFVRDMDERADYASSPPCLDEPARDCWVESPATVVGKRVDKRSIFVDDHILALNELGGPEVTLAGGHSLWTAVDLGDIVTVRHWRGEVVMVSTGGQHADTVNSPRVGAERLYAACLITFGLGSLLILVGLGGLGLARQRPAGAPRHPVAAWSARVALAALCVGATGLAAEFYTRAAPVPLVTMIGIGVLVAAGAVVRIARARLAR